MHHTVTVSAGRGTAHGAAVLPESQAFEGVLEESVLIGLALAQRANQGYMHAPQVR
jgi:hypothetical protein